MTSEQTEVGAARLVRGDVLQWAAEYDGSPFHAALLDPPYELGFMSRKWDSTGIAFRPETWAALGKHLHPGAFCMAFGSCRGWHRMAVAIEDAGFVIHPSMFFLYCFGNGFPKATRVPDERFAGHRYGQQAIKPSVEPLIMFQKPYKGKPVDSITRTGAGALNVEAGRVGTEKGWPASESQFRGWRKMGQSEKTEPRGNGRWPSNLLLDDSSAAALDQMSGTYVRHEKRPHKLHPRSPQETARVYNGGWTPETTPTYHINGGASQFFFQSDWNAETLERLDDALPFFYCAKAGRGERDAGLEGFPLGDPPGSKRSKPAEGRQNALGEPRANHHPTVKPLRLTRYLASLLLPPADYAPRRLLVPFSGVASEMCGALLAGWEHVTGIEGEAEYCEIAAARLKFWQCNSGLFESLTADDGEEPPELYGFGFEEEAS